MALALSVQQHLCKYLNIQLLFLYNRVKERKMKMLILVLMQFGKCVLLSSMPKARHQKLLAHELVNCEFICEGNSNSPMTYIK